MEEQHLKLVSFVVPGRGHQGGGGRCFLNLLDDEQRLRPVLLHSLLPTCPVPAAASAAVLSAAVCFDYIFDGPSANGAASIGHLLELQPT